MLLIKIPLPTICQHYQDGRNTCQRPDVCEITIVVVGSLHEFKIFFFCISNQSVPVGSVVGEGDEGGLVGLPDPSICPSGPLPHGPFPTADQHYR